MKKRFLLLLIILIGATGCTTHVDRTPLEKWNRRLFKDAGISLEMPKKISRSDILVWNNELHFFLRKVRYPIYHIRDDSELVKVEVRKLTPEDIKREQEWASKSSMVGMWTSPKTHEEKAHNQIFRDKMIQFQPTSTRINGAYGLVFFRRDIMCPDNDMIRAKITWFSTGYPEGVDPEQDIPAFIRILDSIEPLQ